MPFVADTGKAAADPVGELLAEFARALPHGFMADNDAAGGLQLLHHAKSEREAEIQPHGMTDDLDREPVPGVASASKCRHPIRLLTPIRRRKYPGSTKLTVPKTERASSAAGPGCARLLWRRSGSPGAGRLAQHSSSGGSSGLADAAGSRR